ncbi:MAG: sugar phosphate nucleotidyltransferase [Pirellula sp.]
MRAVILAGGRGTRLAPYTTVVPKPLLPVGDKPILEIVCRQLVNAGFNRITLSLGYMSEYFKTFLAQHRALRNLVDIDFIEEDEPTGTAGSLASIPDLRGTFLVMNGDILTDLSYVDLLKHHLKSEAYVTIAAHRKIVKIDLGILELNDDQVCGYIEKPTMTYPVSMGIYVYDSRVLEFINRGEYLDFPNLVLKLIAAGKKVSAFENDASWLDLGRYEDFQEACRIFETREAQFVPRVVAA